MYNQLLTHCGPQVIPRDLSSVILTVQPPALLIIQPAEFADRHSAQTVQLLQLLDDNQMANDRFPHQHILPFGHV